MAAGGMNDYPWLIYTSLGAAVVQGVLDYLAGEHGSR